MTTTMEAHISLLQDFVKTPQIIVDAPHQTIKMEDLEHTIIPDEQCSTPNNSSSLDTSASADTPKPSEAKTTKKRKSWGQVLPEPKTNLPPRKRAKTADEKEQRRIERVKRNRLAAHNSRERKRQEVEALLTHNMALEQRLKDMETELTAYRQMFPKANIEKAPVREDLSAHSHALLMESFQNESKSSTIAPSQASFESPDSLLSTLDSPIDTAPSTPGNEMTANDSDPTQHSAAMLCDLPCRSDINSSLFSTPNFHSVLTFILMYNIQMCLLTAMSTLSSTSTSFRMAATAWLMGRNLSSTPASTARRHTLPFLATPMTYWSQLMQHSSICSPAQARLLQSATRQALRRRALSSKWLRLSSESSGTGVKAAGCER